jgi:hypothetical protein
MGASKSRLPTTCTTTFLIQTTVMSTTQTTSTLETPTLTTCTDTTLIQTTAMSTTLTTSTLETPTLTMPTLLAISTRSSCASGAFHPGISPQPWQCQPNSSSGKSLAKQYPQNRSYLKPRKARKRHKKKRPKPSPPSPPVAGALCAHIKETQQLPDHPPIPLTVESSNEHKKRPNQGLPRKKLSVPSPQKLDHPPSTHPTPSPWRASTAGMQNKDVPHPTPTTHGRQMSRKLVKWPKPPSLLNNLTQIPTTRTTLIVQMHQIQHPPTPTWGHPLHRVSTQSKHAIKHQWGISM